MSWIVRHHARRPPFAGASTLHPVRGGVRGQGLPGVLAVMPAFDDLTKAAGLDDNGADADG